MNIENAIKALFQFKNLVSEDQFDMSVDFIENDPYTCQTIGCFAGWVAFHNGWNPEFYSEMNPLKYAQVFLDLTNEEAENFFQGWFATDASLPYPERCRQLEKVVATMKKHQVIDEFERMITKAKEEQNWPQTAPTSQPIFSQAC